MALHLRLARTIGPAALTCLLLAPLGPGVARAQSEAKPIEGEITRITGGRTSIMVDLEGDLVLDVDATVALTVDGKKRTGTVKKVTKNGIALIKLNKGLPKAVKVGDDVAMTVTSGEVVEAQAAAKPGAVRLQKGGFQKAYWDEVSYLAAHRKAGTRADLEISFLSGAGADKSKGGSAQDDTEFAVSQKHTNVAGTVGFVGRGGFGAGMLLEYDKAAREATAKIDTVATGTTDDDVRGLDRTVTEFTPYGQWLSRATTGGLAFGAGLGFAIRNTTAERTLVVAGVENDGKPAKTTETGPAIELLAGGDSWAFILGLTPVLSGKIKQDGAKDVDHKSGEYGAHFEIYGTSTKARIGIVLSSAEDSYQDATLRESAWRLSTRVDQSFGWFNLVPLLDYTSTKRDKASANATMRETDIGARFAKSGRYAPFLSLSLNLKSAKEKNDDGLEVESNVSGVRFAGGINI